MRVETRSGLCCRRNGQNPTLVAPGRVVPLREDVMFRSLLTSKLRHIVIVTMAFWIVWASVVLGLLLALWSKEASIKAERASWAIQKAALSEKAATERTSLQRKLTNAERQVSAAK